VALAALVLLTACAGKTRYVIDLDILSFIPKSEHTRDWTLESGASDHLLLLPYYGEVVDDVSTVDAELREGTELEFPVPDSPAKGDITLTFAADVDVSNGSGSTNIETAEIRLFAAKANVDDVYTNGNKVLSFSLSGLGPNQSRNLSGKRTIEQGDPGYDLLTSGKVRLGAEGYFEAATGTNIAAGYSLNKLRVTVSVRPFSLLP
jgi:hypothetical protein